MTTVYKKTLEKARQRFKVSIDDGDLEFRPTSNDRNNAMLRESQRFSQALKAVLKDLTEIDRTVFAGLNTVRKVLETPLPRAYEDSAGGAFPEERELTQVGQGVHVDALVAASTEGRSRLRTQVLAPVEQWLEAYKIIKDRNAVLEGVRLELDVKRRSFLSYKAKFNKATDKSHSLQEQEEIYHRAQTEEDKMNRLIQRYLDLEGEVFGALSVLVKDSHHLRDYLAAAMIILKSSFGGAVWAFKEAYPGLEVEEVSHAVANALKPEKVDLNQRFSYLHTASIASQRAAAAQTVEEEEAEEDLPIVTLGPSTSVGGKSGKFV